MVVDLYHAGFNRDEIRSALLLPQDVVDAQLSGSHAPEPVDDKRLNLTSQMYRLNTECWRQARLAIGEGDRETALKFMVEIRRQFETLAKIEAQVFATKDVRLFQEVVLKSVQAVDPELRLRIEQEFARRRSRALIGG
jgi:hypothetical protein